MMASSAWAVLALVMLPQGQVKNVNLALGNVSPRDAITAVVEAGGMSWAIQDVLPEEPRVSLKLEEVKPGDAIKMVAEAAGLLVQPVSDTLLSIHGQTRATVGGRTVPVYGAVPGTRVGRSAGGGPALTFELQAPTVELAEASAPSFEGDGALVDLEVEDAPLREVASKLSDTARIRWLLQHPRIEVIVDESVPEGIRVTAKVRRTPLREVLRMIVGAAGLTYAVEERAQPFLERMFEVQLHEGLVGPEEVARRLGEAPRVPAVYIVPKPELRVSGTMPAASDLAKE